ncbi:RNA-dependent RNA polymerase 1-like isoform X2 [Vicia villosa]|uniref:RNA-dependent RNA polymerase 1-like isoform X2 n=2 Tax=Vicia villosa TaxID=3911 RepID=UPI00273CA1F6|nr:RNA-dependent RNA polymerase 1-like isoform X2 [Vicia villosa]
MGRDINPKSSATEYSLNHVKLYFGCPISKEKLSVLWRNVDVSLVFEIGMGKWRFSMCHNSMKFKLELSNENIWKIELHQQPGKTEKYLLIQLICAPRIFEHYVYTSATVLNDNYSVLPRERWIPTTDFTPRSCIGQSSVLCLELPSDSDLPNFSKNFTSYEESEGEYILEDGSPFSCNRDIVPMVAPSQGIKVPFDILFKVNSLVQHGCLLGTKLNNDFYRQVDPRNYETGLIEHALEKMYFSKDFCYEPAEWLKNQYTNNQQPWSPSISLDNGFYVRKVLITPCKAYFRGPEITVSNCVLRRFHKYIDNFLLVSFVDEGLNRLCSADLTTSIPENDRSEIYYRILSILMNGINICGWEFEFLAFSSSQLHESSLWMFARTTTGITSNSIRKWMGDFSGIKNVAKYAATFGQSFDSSTETLRVSKEDIKFIPDVQDENTEYVFSDGIGKISRELAKKVAEKCGLDSMPSAFQIRWGGYEGVVAVDPTLDFKLSLRKSMHKYDSRIEELDVLAYSTFQPCYLNRQLITLLSTLGVEDSVFEKKQKEAVDQLNAILTDSTKAQEVLDLMSFGEITNILKEMLICGYKPNIEPFLSMMLQRFRESKLLELLQKTRILIPKGREMMGVLDETRTLEYGEVFIQYSNSSFSSCPHVVKGEVVVVKNPCLHPGDVRVLKAVDVTDLNHMVDCIVFPQKGHRPHPNECSGSDLDGDIYFVCWDLELIPPHRIEPMKYDSAQPKVLNRDVEIMDVEKFFANYSVNDSLGIIVDAHTVHADKETKKAMSEPCIELAKLFSIAVGFPKTGVPAVLPPKLSVKEYPDFMEKHDKPTYESDNVIGKLFRKIQGISTKEVSITSFTFELAKKSYDPDMEVVGFMSYVEDAFSKKSNYDCKLGNLMDYYGIKSESEILTENIMKTSKSFTKRRDSDVDAITMAVRSLRKEARSWFNDGLDSGSVDTNAKASAWYYVTYHHSYYGKYNEGMNMEHLLSFPWCVYDLLVEIKKEKARMSMPSSRE